MDEMNGWDQGESAQSAERNTYEVQPMKPATQIILMGVSLTMGVVVILAAVLAFLRIFPLVLAADLFPLTALSLVAMIGIPTPLVIIAVIVFRFAKSEPDTNMDNPAARQRTAKLLRKLGYYLQMEAFFFIFLAVLVPTLVWADSKLFYVVQIVGLIGFWVGGVILESKAKKLKAS